MADNTTDNTNLVFEFEFDHTIDLKPEHMAEITLALGKVFRLLSPADNGAALVLRRSPPAVTRRVCYRVEDRRRRGSPPAATDENVAQHEQTAVDGASDIVHDPEASSQTEESQTPQDDQPSCASVAGPCP